MCARRIAPFLSAEDDDEEAETTDEDMGFGLFDSDDGTQETLARDEDVANTAIATPSPLKNRKIEESGTLIQRLIAHQYFQGFWSALSTQLCRDMHIKEEYAMAEQTLITAIVVVFLEEKMQDEQDTWELVVEKARTWLEGALEGDVLEDVWRMAAKIVG